MQEPVRSSTFPLSFGSCLLLLKVPGKWFLLVYIHGVAGAGFSSFLIGIGFMLSEGAFARCGWFAPYVCRIVHFPFYMLLRELGSWGLGFLFDWDGLCKIRIAS